jgi:hypothetical protein
MVSEFLLSNETSMVEVLDSLVGCDLGNTRLKAVKIFVNVTAREKIHGQLRN